MKKIFVSRDIVFNERELLCGKSDQDKAVYSYASDGKKQELLVKDSPSSHEAVIKGGIPR